MRARRPTVSPSIMFRWMLWSKRTRQVDELWNRSSWWSTRQSFRMIAGCRSSTESHRRVYTLMRVALGLTGAGGLTIPDARGDEHPRVLVPSR